MGFFENSLENAKAALDVAQNKTEKAVLISKKMIEEKRLQNRLKTLYSSLGERYYYALKNNSADSENFKDLLSAIDAVRGEIKAVRKEINALKDKKTCPNCGALIGADSEYCGRCGAKSE